MHPFATSAATSAANRATRRAMALAGTTLMAAALLTWAPAVAIGWNQGSAEATLWQLMNGARVNNGLRAVQQHSTLVSLARWRSRDQVERNYFSHTILGTGYQVYHWYDTNGLNYVLGGENIGWNNGYADGDSPVAIHEGFMNSTGHRANILEPAWTHGGVGAFAADNVEFLGKVRSPRFYTELFMQAASAAAPPPPPPPSNPNPPPSGGGSGGGGGGAAAPAPSSTPAPSVNSVGRVAAPSPAAPLDGATPVANVDHGAASAERALARLRSLDEALPAAPAATAAVAADGSLRIEAAAAPRDGVFETVLGSLLGFFF